MSRVPTSVYIDSSVALARLFGEERVPSADLWNESLVSSRLLEYEVWNRVHVRGLTAGYGDTVRELLATVILAELTPHVLERALEPFPVPVRTLDALHLATIDSLHSQGSPIELASYDRRLLAGARALRIPIREF